MGIYSSQFTLNEIVLNPTLQKKLPLGLHKNKDNVLSRKISNNAQLRIIATEILNLTKSAARPFYKPLNVARNNRTIIVSGKLKTSYNSAYNGICKAIEGKRRLLGTIVSNNELVRSAVIENMRHAKMPNKLFLRISSISQIKKMNANQLYGLMNDIADNIKYSGNYPQTEKLLGMNKSEYEAARLKWAKKVGAK